MQYNIYLMGKLKFIVSRRLNPFFNVRMDEKMLYLVGNDAMNQSVRFYKNRDSVILGRFQCIELEVNEEYCKSNNISVLKRVSGGGAVFHDENNLNVSVYLTDRSMPSKYLIESMKIFSFAIKEALNSFGVPAEIGIHGEVLIYGKKVSGCASAKKFGGFLYHATLLLNVNTEKLRMALSPPKNVKVNRHCVLSNRAKIINLYDVKVIPEKEIMDSIYEHFESVLK